jgi:hypothetical protein
VSIIVLQKDETDQRKIIFAINQAIQWINTKGGSGGGGGGGGGDGAGGRLSLISGDPVMSSHVNPGVASSLIYYTPYKGSFVPVWNGTGWSSGDTGGELSQALSDATKSPAAAALDTLYDMFVWQDGSTMRCTRGDAWASFTGRASPLAVNAGLITNGTNITNGPLAGTGLYVGTIKINPSLLLSAYRPPGIGDDSTCFGDLDIWNYYNRINFAGTVQENSPGNWPFGATSWGMAGGFSNFLFRYICGIDEDFMFARYDAQVENFTSFDIGYVGIGVDTTLTPSGVATGVGNSSATEVNYSPAVAIYAGNPGIGAHYIAAIEKTSAGSTNGIFYGDLNGGLTVNWKF